MMRKRMVVIAVCGMLALAIGGTPRYLEELRIGGGYSEPVDGGADFDKAGNVSTNGAVVCNTLTAAGGAIEGGKDTQVRGLVTVWDGAGGNAPGCLKLGSTNGALRYLFASNDGTGLRIHSALPTSDSDGEWLKAKTVTDLSSPPPIGTVTPNTGKFTTLASTDKVNLGGNTIVRSGGTAHDGDTLLHVHGGHSGWSGTRDYYVLRGLLVENDDHAVIEIQCPASKNASLWFGDSASEYSGEISYVHPDNRMLFMTNNCNSAYAMVLDHNQNLRVSGDVEVDGGDLTTTQTSFSLLNTTASILNIGGAAGLVTIGASTGTTTINHNLDVDDRIKGDSYAVDGLNSAPQPNDSGTIGEVRICSDGIYVCVSGSNPKWKKAALGAY